MQTSSQGNKSMKLFFWTKTEKLNQTLQLYTWKWKHITGEWKQNVKMIILPTKCFAACRGHSVTLCQQFVSFASVFISPKELSHLIPQWHKWELNIVSRAMTDQPQSDIIFLCVYLLWRIFHYCGFYPRLRIFTAVLPLETATDAISSHSVGHEGGHGCWVSVFHSPVLKRDKSCQTVHLKKNGAITTVDTEVIIVISQQWNVSILYPRL